MSDPQSVEISVRDVPVTNEDLLQLQGIISGIVGAAVSERPIPEPEGAVLVDVLLRLTWTRPT